MKQSILIRGMDVQNPILLFLHGGPGYPQIAYARKFQTELEKDFIVVNWDQRGSGKSYQISLTEKDMQIDHLIQDTVELTIYLKQKFHQAKIILAGHSWGSLLATWTVQKYPEHYHAYIGIGQVANSMRGEQVSYQFALEEARKQKNVQAIRELEDIGAPPYKNPRKDTTLERKWVTTFGGSERRSNTYRELVQGILLAPEYTWIDGVRLVLGDSFSRNTIMPQTEKTQLCESVPELRVPVYLCMGQYDFMTPSEVAYQYYEKLVAPEKQFIWFEESAHFPHFEEKEKFHALLVAIKEKISNRGVPGRSRQVS
ncbi:alpha/beta hydrolase [Brevibacillus ruminantium]|uniref:prolyl aminopeptidase n=1 Tax=Brevibacillus ruminantium TaxID=2950604 RepID=A0ABY4W9N9_9BACL|nr:alpha/beta hydrolase [Brevibacillus ruminantium]USG63742.1 alpha/beta hydrolase [Brevibacillus ruminantium]